LRRRRAKASRRALLCAKALLRATVVLRRATVGRSARARVLRRAKAVWARVLLRARVALRRARVARTAVRTRALSIVVPAAKGVLQRWPRTVVRRRPVRIARRRAVTPVASVALRRRRAAAPTGRRTLLPLVPSVVRGRPSIVVEALRRSLVVVEARTARAVARAPPWRLAEPAATRRRAASVVLIIPLAAAAEVVSAEFIPRRRWRPAAVPVPLTGTPGRARP